MKEWIFALLLFVLSHSLVVEEVVYEHITGDFGPYEYSVQANAVFTQPTTFCASFDQTNCTGQIAFILRGNCTFVDKVLAAQARGAVGAVIGNNDPFGQLVRMSSDSAEHQTDVKIPAVFISFTDYLAIHDLVDLNIKPTRVLLDAQGEVSWSNSSLMSWMLIMPLLWCAGLMLVYLRRFCQQRCQRVERISQTRRLPDVEYHKTPDATERKVHNDTCAVCLEEFAEGTRIKMLPCQHGFHGDCIEPWLNERSDRCPMCNASILAPGAAPRRPVDEFEPIDVHVMQQALLQQDHHQGDPLLDAVPDSHAPVAPETPLVDPVRDRD